MRRSVFVALATAGFLLLASTAFAQTASEVSVASPSGLTPRNHQNEPAVAMDANNPNFLVAGSNDLIDEQPCPKDDATQLGTCWDRIKGIGISGVYFSFNRGHSWVQPTYPHGWTAADCGVQTECDGHVGPIHTLPWYYESGLVSLGDPAVAVGPRPGNGGFSWANGSRVYYANLATAFSLQTDFPFPNRRFHGFTAMAVSRLDNPTPASVRQKGSWKAPVLVVKHQGQTAFLDKEQIWADNAASSHFFGRVYVCGVQFRSNGFHGPGTFPQPVMVSWSPDGGNDWHTKQVTAAAASGHGKTEWGMSGCTIRTDSQGVVYLFTEQFQRPDVSGLPTHGAHVMLQSFDGGVHWTKPRILFRITDPCNFIDPIVGRCVMDGYAGARTDLSAAPSVDIANGAPTGGDATNAIVDAWSDASPGLNHEKTMVSWSTDRGATWASPVPVSRAGDRSMYSAPAISPDGSRIYVVYEGPTAPWRGANMFLPRPYHGVFLTASFGAGGPSGWRTLYNGPTGDLRGTYPGHDIYQERVGDYVYAAASRTYGAGVWTDARNAAVCQAVQRYRSDSLNAGALALPAPWPLRDCPAGFGNTDIWSATSG